jgi:hypothetical protein
MKNRNTLPIAVFRIVTPCGHVRGYRSSIFSMKVETVHFLKSMATTHKTHDITTQKTIIDIFTAAP